VELDDYNLATLFRVEKVKEHIDLDLKKAKLRLGHPLCLIIQRLEDSLRDEEENG